jgi:hypothetical protein
VPILGSGSGPTTDDTLQQFLQHAGALFGKDPTKWDKVGESELHDMQCSYSQQHKSNTHVMMAYCPAGEPTTDITEQDGKRIIKRTGMYTGTELHLIRYAGRACNTKCCLQQTRPALVLANALVEHMPTSS